MAIFGTCADMMLPDVLAILGRRKGVLALRDLEELESGSTRKCTFTLGAITACVEEAYGIKLTAKQVASVLSGSQTDDFLLTPYNG